MIINHMRPNIIIIDDLKNFIQFVFRILKKVAFVTDEPKDKGYFMSLKATIQNKIQMIYIIGNLHIKFNSVEFIQ